MIFILQLIYVSLMLNSYPVFVNKNKLWEHWSLVDAEGEADNIILLYTLYIFMALYFTSLPCIPPKKFQYFHTLDTALVTNLYLLRILLDDLDTILLWEDQYSTLFLLSSLRFFRFCKMTKICAIYMFLAFYSRIKHKNWSNIEWGRQKVSTTVGSLFYVIFALGPSFFISFTNL